MVSLNSIVILMAALGAASAKSGKNKRQCSSSAPPTATDTGAPASGTDGAPAAPSGTPPPSGGSQSGTGQYSQKSNLVGDDFFSAFSWWANSDPTHGHVKYVDVDTAKSNNLSVAASDSFIIRADPSPSIDPNDGRMSVRIQMNDAVETHVSVLDIAHIPEGKGTWPAYWTCGQNWPNGGELDIIEGVNDGEINLTSLHTSPGCTMPDAGGDRSMSGTADYENCDANGPKGNQGCGVSGTQNSFGPSFNQAGGGWYAVEHTDTFIKVWFWQRDDGSVPAEVKSNTGAVSPTNWGQPMAMFVNDQCDLASKFGPNNYIINLTLCGDWAGNAFDGGMDACNDFVNNPGDGLQNAYFDIKRMSIYE